MTNPHGYLTEPRWFTVRAVAQDVRIAGCEACGTEGRILERGNWWDARSGEWVTCPQCWGTGCGEMVDVQPIELDDFETAYGSAR